MPSAFGTYGDLKTRIAAECERASIANFATEIPRFVDLAEQRIYRGSGAPFPTPPVRVRDMEAVSASLAVTTGAATLPADFLEVRAVNTTTGIPLTGQTTQTFLALRDPATTGTAKTYALEGGTLLVSPTLATGSISLRYYKRYASLSADADTNWLLTNAPGLYFWAAVGEAYSYIRDQVKQAEAIQNYMAAISGLNQTETNAKYGGSGIMPQPNFLPPAGTAPSASN